jgi:hypothetical protein
MDAFKLILVSLGGWMNHPQQHVIESLWEEEIGILGESSLAAAPGAEMPRLPRTQ